MPYWRERDIGYTGPSFPFRFGPDGSVVRTTANPMTGQSEHIREALAQLMLTKPGERFFNRGFGAAPIHLLFEINDATSISIWASEVVDLTRIWEPRVHLRDVQIRALDPEQGLAVVGVLYRMIRSQTEEYVPLVVRG